MTGITIIIQLLIHLAEAKHDYHVIQGKNMNKVEHNKAWHKWDAVVWVLVHSCIALAAMNWVLLLTGLAWRFILLQVALNYLRPGISIDHLGTGTIDAACEKILTRKGTLIVKIILAAILISYAGIEIFQSVFQG